MARTKESMKINIYVIWKYAVGTLINSRLTVVFLTVNNRRFYLAGIKLTLFN